MSLKCIDFLNVIKSIIGNDCFVICVGSFLLLKTVDVTLPLFLISGVGVDGTSVSKSVGEITNIEPCSADKNSSLSTSVASSVNKLVLFVFYTPNFLDPVKIQKYEYIYICTHIYML